MKRFLIIICMMFLISSCAPKIEDNNKFTIYTSFYAVEKLTEMIAGEKAEVEMLISSGADVHNWEPSSADMVALNNADLFIYSSNTMEPWAEKVIESIGKPELTAVEASGGIVGSGVNTDPHIWLKPENAILMLENIADAIITADSVNKEYYTAQLEDARGELMALDAEFRAAAEEFADREIIVTHGAFGYLCEAYGLEQYVIEGISGESDPSSAKLKEVIDRINEKEIRSVFYVTSESDKVARLIAEETGARVFALNTFGSGAGEGYAEVMRENLEVLKEALNG